MAAKSAPAPPELPAYLVAVPFNRVDPDTRRDTRFEAGEPYDGPATDEYLDRGLIVPAAADSASESSSTEDQEK